ncbi:hypothetical protein P376_1943 [Streptomyces sp. HCCB10043]|nr:hypothetical protein P376_1943 [Streptomyces sp. HCCB10043]
MHRVARAHRAGGAGHSVRRGLAALVQRDRAGVPGPRVAALHLEHLQAVLDEPAHLLGALEPVVRVLRQRAHHHSVQLRRHHVRDLGRRHRDVLDVLVDHRERGLAGERGPQRQQLVEQAAGGVQVGPVVDGLAERLLGGEVLRGAHDHAGLGHRRLRAVERAGDAEVHHLDRAGIRDDHVGGLDVAVHDAVLVGVREGFQHPRDDDQRLLGRRGLGGQEQISDRAALDQFHHDVRDGLAAHDVLAGVVHGDDRVVVEACDGLCLAGEAGLGDRVLGQIGTEQLHRYRASEPDVLRRVDLCHAAPAEPVGHPVTAVTDDAADAPGVGAIRNSAAVCFGIGCHQSSPSYLSARPRVLTVPCCTCCIATSRYSLRRTPRFRSGRIIGPPGASSP